MSGVVHLHRKVVVSLSVGSLPTYLVFFFFLGGVILIPSGGSINDAIDAKDDMNIGKFQKR